MTIVNFQEYSYYPCLQSSQGEHIGYSNLETDVKADLVPIFELSRRAKNPDLNAAEEVIRATSNGDPFILDLCHDPAPQPILPRDPTRARAAQAQYQQDTAAQQSYNFQLRQLLNPDDGFASWRQVIGRFPNAIPVLQYTDAITQSRAVLRQATALSANEGCLAIKIKLASTAGTADLVANIIAILGTPERLLIIFDCGMARRRTINAIETIADFTRNLIRLVDADEARSLNIAIISSSFTARSHENLQELQNLDLPLWLEAREFYNYAFGDYGATIRRSSQFVPPDWRAQPVYPLDNSWLAYRHHAPNDENGWIVGCQQIMEHQSYNPTPHCWGVSIIEQAARGNIENISSSRHWYAAKTNIHISRMTRRVPLLIAGEFGPDD